MMKLKNKVINNLQDVSRESMLDIFGEKCLSSLENKHNIKPFMDDSNNLKSIINFTGYVLDGCEIESLTMRIRNGIVCFSIGIYL